jgi:hypothetical protein
MKRRDFFKTSLAGSALAALGTKSFTANASDQTGRQYYELRAYRLKSDSSHDLLDNYLEKAAIPALNRLGANPVGVFTEPDAKDGSTVYVLIPYPSIEVFATATNKLATDEEHLKAGAEYLQVAKNNPQFIRIDTWLLLAFAGQPKLEQPAYSKEKKERFFELRTYESYSEAKAIRKIEMFNAGEIEVMHQVGLGPVFFAQALAGSNLPHLTYMVSGEDRDEHKKHWAGFGSNPVWKKLSTDESFKDTVSKSISQFLIPTSYSQL